MKNQANTSDSRNRTSGLLRNLRNDASGNVIAMMAASMVPVVGLVGAGLDFSRDYLTKTRLQAACDAGALAGKKEMDSGSFTTAAEAQADQMFAANYPEHTAGAEHVTHTFRAIGSAVEGSASADVPMTLLKLFGSESDHISVLCRADAGTQNVDVMMVLDNTGSMNSHDSGSSLSRIEGLKHATKCFYETVTHIDSSENCGSTPDGRARSAQVRIGFVPYSTNVNVGKLLPHSFMADTWNYQSRVWGAPIPTGAVETTYTETISTGTAGTPAVEPTAATIASTSSPSAPTSLSNTTAVTMGTGASSATSVRRAGTTCTGSCTSVNFTAPAIGAFTFGTSGSQNGSNYTAGGITYQKENERVPKSSSQTGQQACDAAGPPANNTTITASGNPTNFTVSTIAPVYPATTQTNAYSTTQTYSTTRVRYIYKEPKETGFVKCELYTITATTNVTATWNATQTVTWNPPTAGTPAVPGTPGATVLTPVTTPITAGTLGWTYRQVEHNVAGLKGAGSAWNNSVSLPLETGGLAATIAWDGCIEERKTYRDTDGNIFADWSTIPSDAIDMDLKRVPDPSNHDTLWGPALKDAVWGRYNQAITSSTTAGGPRGSNWTLDDVVTTTNLNLNLNDPNPDVDPSMRNRSTAYACPQEGRLLSTWSTASAFDSYVNGMTPGGNTYHDIGLIWGGRFLLDGGIFKDVNPDYYNAANGKVIEKHLVFMTDGETNTQIINYAAYGIPWWDRRQNRANVAPTTQEMNDLTDARMTALCSAIKNQNVTLWVVAFGSAINSTSSTAAIQAKTRLTACATDSSHFFTARTSDDLNYAFNQIGGQIGGLRIEQ